MQGIQLEQAVAPLVMAIDVGSSSVRTLLYDARGSQISASEHQLPHTLATTHDGGSTADPDHLVSLTCNCIDMTLAHAGARGAEIRAVGLTTFWHSLLGLDANRQPTTPVLMWADKRSGQDAQALAETLDARRIHTETGCRLHSSYWPAKLRWIQRTAPEAYARTRTWVSFADFLSWTINREMMTSISMASGTGMLDSSGARWHPDMLDLLGLQSTDLPLLTDRDLALPAPVEPYRARWPQLADAAWFPAIGDGATANVGAGCVGGDRIALTLGTSGAMRAIIRDDVDHTPMERPLSPKLWQYRLDRQHRVAGGALSNGGNAIAWLSRLTGVVDINALAMIATGIAPDSHGLTLLPFLAGERSPSWNDDLTGLIAGLRLDTSAADIFRAMLESTAYRFDSIYEDLKDLVEPDHVICANGGAILGSPLWMQVIADVLDHPIEALAEDAEASARGAAICALQSIRAIDSLLAPVTRVVDRSYPVAGSHDIYRAARQRLERYEAAFGSLK